MKLEFKHLNAYLPYDIQMYYNGKSLLLTGLDKDAFSDVFVFTLLYEDGISRPQTDCFKPILRRKSYLDKLGDEISIRWGGCLTEITKGKFVKRVIENLKYSDSTSLRYDEVQFMLEHHIDVFGLLENNLAVEMEETK